MNLGDVPTLIALIAVLQAIVIAVLAVDRRRRRRASEQNRAVLACVFADMAIVNADAVVEWCNDNWIRSRSAANPFLSAAPGEPWIRPAGDDVAQPDRVRVRAALASVLSGADTEHTLEYAWQDGVQHRWSQLRLCALSRPGGGAVIAHLDISGPKRVEDDARFVRHELAQMNMRTAMGEVVAGIAHEVSQSLAASLGNAQALKRMLDDRHTTSGEVAAVVEDIWGANTQASEVIRRIKTLMRKEPLDVQILDVNAVVLEVIHVLRSSAEREGVLLSADLHPTLPALTGDRVQLRQVAMNLILNAIEATRDARGDRATVRVSTSTDDCCVMLTVDDEGDGVPETALSRVFEPYFTTKRGGLGVGLSISRSIVEAHGGSIRAENLPQAGARFVVVLPAA